MSRSPLTRYSLALAVVGLALGVRAAAAETPEDLARDLRPSQRPLFELGGTSKQDSVALDAWIDNPEGVYSVGQRLKVYVRPKETSYITVLNVGSSGRVAVIFPNHYQRNMRVRAGETVRIPAEDSNWHIDVAGPAGIEVIKIIASREPLRLRELERLAGTSEDQPLVSLDRSGEEVARDLVPQLKSKTSSSVIIPGGVKSLLVRVVQRGGQLERPGSREVPGAFGLTLRPERPVYKIGDTVRVAVAVEKDCPLSLISLGTSGQAVRLVPNELQPDNVIRPGSPCSSPRSARRSSSRRAGPPAISMSSGCRAGFSSPIERAPDLNGDMA